MIWALRLIALLTLVACAAPQPLCEADKDGGIGGTGGCITSTEH